MNLKTLIEHLEQLPGDKPVVYSDGKFPGKLHSYRGDYHELALDRRANPNYQCWDITTRYDRLPTPTVQLLLDDARAAVGNTFVGYKGGDFCMENWTDVWVSEEGCADNLHLLGFLEEGDRVIILTSDSESLLAIIENDRRRIAELETRLAEVSA